MLSIMNASSRFLLAWRASTQKSLCLTHWFHIGISSGKLLFGFGILVEAVTTCDGEITWKCDLDWGSYWLTSQRCLPWIACQGNGGDEMVRGSLSGHQKVLGKCKRSKQQCFQWVLLACSWGLQESVSTGSSQEELQTSAEQSLLHHLPWFECEMSPTSSCV